MLGWLLLGGILAAAAIVIYVSYLDRYTAQQKLGELGNIIKAKVKEKSGNTVKLDALDDMGNTQEVEMTASDGVSSDIYEGQTIYV